MSEDRPTPYELATDPRRKWGAAMAKLTPLQRAWVLASVEQGCNATRAAAEAGYGADSPTLKARAKAQLQAGWLCANNPDVQVAIKEEAASRVRSGALLSISAITEIVSDPRHKDRFKAAITLAAMNGMQAIQVQEVKHTHRYEDISTRDLITKIKTFAVTNGLDAAHLLANAGVVDAEFEEIGDQRALTYDPAPSSEGLEDLLG